MLFLADQTPTPTTRLIRNCEEFGLFDDLKHVNPFEETFRQAIDGKGRSSNISLTTQKSLELIKCNDEETLHTPIPCKYTISNAEKETKTTPNDSSTAKLSGDLHMVQSTKAVTTTTPIRKKMNWPKGLEHSEKSPDTTGRKSFRKIHPKPVTVSTVSNISNPIKEKIRQSLLKFQLMHNDKNPTNANVSISNVDIPKKENKSKVIRMKKNNSKDGSANERNREAAKRYRNKQKILHDKLLIRNAQLEAEVVQLRHHLEIFKKAHEKCSVTQNCGTFVSKCTK